MLGPVPTEKKAGVYGEEFIVVFGAVGLGHFTSKLDGKTLCLLENISRIKMS